MLLQYFLVIFRNRFVWHRLVSLTSHYSLVILVTPQYQHHIIYIHIIIECYIVIYVTEYLENTVRHKKNYNYPPSKQTHGTHSNNVKMMLKILCHVATFLTFKKIIWAEAAVYVSTLLLEFIILFKIFLCRAVFSQIL